MDISTWPVGYSKFLRVFSAFTHSDLALVLFQYLFLEAAIFCFIFTLMYFLKPGRVVLYILMAFAVFNPLLLFMSNYVSADTLFTGLSLLWLSSLVGMLYVADRRLIWAHAVLLVLCFVVRHNALYYPFVSLVAFFYF
ncbi:hypothetical protein MKQ70_23030 [Chitinophaga sedimenti]|uniref:hypothetical protein n=1 Tax=Chitinophaga sedimenti TaxID=2033606 RepID=UPI0020041A35|nr:hypothetical protein [Chitinophaga sedimenti]MCK7557723.1 hypothetical protein [Chitinophaga sedimenti]